MKSTECVDRGIEEREGKREALWSFGRGRVGDALGCGGAGGRLVASRSLRSACLSASLSDFIDYELDTDARVCKTRQERGWIWEPRC